MTFTNNNSMATEKEINKLIPEDILLEINKKHMYQTLLAQCNITKCYIPSATETNDFLKSLKEYTYLSILNKKVFIQQHNKINIERLDVSKFILQKRKKDAEYIILKNNPLKHTSGYCHKIIKSKLGDCHLLITLSGTWLDQVKTLKTILSNYENQSSRYIELEYKDFFLNKKVASYTILKELQLNDNQLDLLEPTAEVIDSVINLIKNENYAIAYTLLSQYSLDSSNYPVLFKLLYYYKFRSYGLPANIVRLLKLLENNSQNVFY